MGMFDNVDFEMECPICGEKINNFQSKDGSCILTTLSPCEVNNFYSSCDNCDSYIDINKKEDKYICKAFHYDKDKKKDVIHKEFEIEVCHKIEIDISLEEYYILNEEARKEGILLDDFINKILKEKINNDKFRDKEER